MNAFISALVWAVFFSAIGALFLLSTSKVASQHQQESILISRTHNIDTSSFYWNEKDIRDISKLKSKYTSVVVADSFTYKAWSIDIQKYVAPFDTIDWCKMEILSYHKKN